jgi:hypothetical protein
MIDSMITAPLLVLTMSDKRIVRWASAPRQFSILECERTVQQRQMITLFCRKLSSFQVRHHALCTSINMDKGILNRCHGGYREDLLSASEFVRVE